MLLTKNRHAKHQEDIRRAAEDAKQRKQWADQHRLFEKKPALANSCYHDTAATVDIKAVTEGHSKRNVVLDGTHKPVPHSTELKNIIES